jgi:gliding motility-associated-like protein
MNKFIPYIFLILGFCISNETQAQILINEFSGANYNQFFDNYGEDEDWIELYNAGTSTVNLSGYHLSDKLANPTKFVIPAGVTIGPGAYRVVWLSDRNQYLGGVLHTNFKITQTKGNEDIVLAGPSGTVIDYHPWDVPNKSGHSWARMTDGSANWGVSTNPSPGASNSNVNDPYVSKPEIFPSAGFYTGNVQVTITVADPNAVIYYTLDGSVPTTSSTLYNGPINLIFTSPVKAIAVNPGNPNALPSFIDYHTFFINSPHTIPVVSVSGNSIMTLMNGAWNAEPVGTFELFDQNGIRVADASGEFNKHGNDSWAYPQRGIDYITRDEFGDDYAVKHSIFDPQITDRDEFQRIILKAAANDNYPFQNGGAHIRDAYVHTLSQLAGLEMDERTNEPCILYVNGEYWGVYEMREKVDDNDFTKYYYDQGREWIDFLKTWGNTWAEYGSAADWNSLRNFILSNDMSIAANYAYVEDQLEVLSLIDYIVLHSHNVSSDWLNWNTAWWRGRKPTGGAKKWRYALWDEDATFGHYINYTGIPDVSPNADPCNPEVLGNPGGQGHIPIFNALLNNYDFLSLYINRYADLNNTYFTCDFMIDLLDDMIGRIEPEMQQHTARWGGSVNGWQNNVQELRDFILLRCTVISDGIVDCYEDEGITGPFNITVNVIPPGSGDVQINTLTGLNYPWYAEYFGGVDFDLTAIPDCGYSFDHWTVDNHTFGPDQFSEAIYMSLITDDVITAYFNNNNTPLVLDAISPLCTESQPVPLSATPSGGTWTGIPNGIFDPQNFGSGTQTVTYVYTYPSGCVDSLSMDIIIIDSPTVTISGPSTFCAGSSATLDAGNGFTSYIWNTGSTNQTVDVFNTGTYSVTVTDINGCTGVDDIITNNIDAITIDANFNAAGCQGDCDGFIDISVQGGSTPYDYSWSNGETTEDLNNLCFGIYTVIVTDVEGCTATQEYNLAAPNGLNIDATQSNSTCFLACDGQIDLQVTGGLEPYTYQWDCGDLTTASQQNLCGGICNVTVTDANGCETTASFTTEEPEELLATLSPESVSCEGECDGFVALSVTGGTAPYAFFWSNNTTASDLSQACAGAYSVIVTDANGCTVQGQVIINQPNAIEINAVTSPPLCGTNCEGSILVNINGGTAPFDFLWNDNSTTEDRTGLCEGTYNLTVTDANGCSQISFYSIIENQTPAPTIAGATSFCSGSITTLDAGTGYISYLWSTGDTTQSITVSNGGTYTVIVTDLNGCTGSDEVQVTSFQNPNPIISGSSTFCSGSNTTLDAGNYASYLWSTGETTSTILVNTSGTYTVDIIDQNGCTGMASIDVTESSSITPSISGEPAFCVGSSTILNAGAGFNTYLWSDGSTNQNFEVFIAGDYSITVSDSQGCSGEATISIIEINPPVATLQNNTSTCNTNAGGSVLNLYDLILTGDMNGTWEDADNSGAVGLFNNLNFDAIAPGDYNFIYTTNSAISPCAEISYPVTVTVNDCSCPDVQFFSNDPLCNSNDVLDLTTIENTTEDGTWTIIQSPTGVNPATLTNGLFETSGSDVGEYVLQFELTNPQAPGCPTEYFVSIDVDQAAEAGVPLMISDFCKNDQEIIVLDNFISGADQNGSWTEISMIPSQFSAFDATNGTFEIDVQTEGVYTFQYTVSSNGACPEDFVEVSVVINPLPVTEVVETTVGLNCNNTSITLDATGSSSGPGFEIEWTGPGIVLDGNENTLTPTCDAPGQYIITITNNTTGCALTNSIQVVDDFNAPQLSVIANETLDCNSTIATLQIDGDTNSPFQIQWSGPGIDATNENSSAPEVGLPGTYHVTIINPDNGCSNSDSIVVFQNIESPDIVIQSALEELDCNNPIADLIADSPNPNITYEWFDEQNNSIGNTSVINDISQVGIYTVIITDTNNGCTSSEFIEVIDNTEYPQAEAGIPTLINCFQPEITLDGGGSQSGPDINYSWSGPGLSGPINESVSMATLPGTYILTVINTTNGCTSTDQVVIGIDTETPEVIVNQPEQLDCIIETVTLDGTGSSIGPDFIYSWLDTNGNIISNDLIVDIQTGGTYTFSILNTANGCENSSSLSVLQNSNFPNAAAIETNDPDCFGDTDGIISIIDITGGIEPYVFALNGTDFTTSPVFENLPPGNYSLTIQDANGCSFENTITINEPVELTVDLGTDLDLQLGDSILIEALVSVPNSQIDTIVWTPANLINCNDPECLEIGISSFNSLEVSAMVVDINGCTDEDEIKIQMRKSRDIFIPNIFSPNDDGYNDFFTIYTNDRQVKNISSFRIFNRWGELMFDANNFQANDFGSGWDGTFKGKPMKPGVFIYMAEIEFIDGRVQLFNGDVTLVK